jgi:hypothetical protein
MWPFNNKPKIVDPPIPEDYESKYKLKIFNLISVDAYKDVVNEHFKHGYKISNTNIKYIQQQYSTIGWLVVGGEIIFEKE